MERRAALARAVRERREFVLPARFDDTPLPGLLSDMVTVDLRTRTPQQFAIMIINKLTALGIGTSAAWTDADRPARDAWAERPTGGTPVDSVLVKADETGHLPAIGVGQEGASDAQGRMSGQGGVDWGSSALLPSGAPSSPLGTAQSMVSWTTAFTRELSEALIAFPDMHNPAFRRLVLRGIGERLGYHDTFPAESHNDYRIHIRAIVYSCKDHEYPPDAVAALVDTIRELRPGTCELERLEDCEASVKGLSVLGAPRLHSVLGIVATLSRTFDRVSIHELAHRIATNGETIPLRGRESLPKSYVDWMPLEKQSWG